MSESSGQNEFRPEAVFCQWAIRYFDRLEQSLQSSLTLGDSHHCPLDDEGALIVQFRLWSHMQDLFV